jgi:hypothetical protein
LIPVLLRRGRRSPPWCLPQGGNTSLCNQGGLGWVIFRMDPMLPSSVRRPATRGDVFGLGSAPSMWQAGLPSRADWVSLPGVRSMRLLHAVSSSDGRWVRGPSTLPWRGFDSLSDELVGGISVVGASVLRSVNGLGGRRRWLVYVLFLGLRLTGLVGCCGRRH